MGEIVDGITRAGGGAFDMEYDRITPVVINDRDLTAWAVETRAGVVGDDRVAEAEPWMAGEDFSRFANEVPGFFFMLGTQKPGTRAAPFPDISRG